MPVNRAAYPPDWPAISAAIRVRSGGQCECEGECGLHHGRRCTERHGEAAKWADGRILLAVAHADRDPTNWRAENLRMLCQRCFRLFDAEQHRVVSRAEREALAEQLEMEL